MWRPIRLTASFTKRRADESYIELVVPKGGVLTRFNNGKGGIHHIAFEVEDVEKIRQEYEAKGLEMLERQAVPGAGGIIVNFFASQIRGRQF